MKTFDSISGPLAIAMWDSTWLRRRFRGGGFEDWDRALQDLTGRGYNAVRIDAYPHLIARGPSGEETEIFKDIPDHHPNFYGFGMWGSPWTSYINPSKALPQFLQLCRHHGVKVILSTWFKPTECRRNEQIEGADGLVRVWDETLQRLDSEGCLDVVIGLDPLNEMPVGFCMQWFHNQLLLLGRASQKSEDPLTSKQHDFIKDFVEESFGTLQNRWPSLSIGISITHADPKTAPIDLSGMDFLDSHIWINFCPEFIKDTRYWETIGMHGHPDHVFRREAIAGEPYAATRYRFLPQDIDYDQIYDGLLQRWREGLPQWERWIKDAIRETADLGRKFQIPVGCTEGWGMVLWTEHPLLDWTIHWESAEIAASEASAQGYRFNCTANFCHPHHVGYWQEVDWHRKVTNTIKGTC